ncbi:MAG: hypothetical protein ACTSVI_12025 [Promethearchaeota archaeon]
MSQKKNQKKKPPENSFFQDCINKIVEFKDDSRENLDITHLRKYDKFLELKLALDWRIFNLESHFIFCHVRSNLDHCKMALARVGVTGIWQWFDMLSSKYIFPRGNPDLSQLKSLLSFDNISWFLDFIVNESSQIFNPNAFVLMNNMMDWDLWNLRVEKIIKNKDSLAILPHWRGRLIIHSGWEEDNVLQPVDIKEATKLVTNILSRGKKPSRVFPLFVKFKRYLSSRFKASFSPYIINIKQEQDKSNDINDVMLISLNPDSEQERKLNALASMFPMTTLYKGPGYIYKIVSKPVSVNIIMLRIKVPRSNIPLFSQIIINLMLSSFKFDPEDFIFYPQVESIPISFPKNYPKNPLKLFSRTKDKSWMRISSMKYGKFHTFDDQWKEQSRMNLNRGKK